MLDLVQDCLQDDAVKNHIHSDISFCKSIAPGNHWISTSKKTTQITDYCNVFLEEDMSLSGCPIFLSNPIFCAQCPSSTLQRNSSRKPNGEFSLCRLNLSTIEEKNFPQQKHSLPKSSNKYLQYYSTIYIYKCIIFMYNVQHIIYFVYDLCRLYNYITKTLTTTATCIPSARPSTSCRRRGSLEGSENHEPIVINGMSYGVPL